VKNVTRTLIRRLSPIRPWYKDVDRENLRADALAGFTNASVVLPQGIAFAVIAGLPPEYGLATAIIGTLIAAIWGASRVMVSGPTTANSAVIFATLTAFAAAGTDSYIQMALTLTLIAGLLQLIAGLAGIGGLITFISQSVIAGFTAAAALLIGVSQLGPAIGLTPHSGGAVTRLLWMGEHWRNINPIDCIISVVTLATAIIISRVHRMLPAHVLALLVGSAAAWALGASSHGVVMFEPLASVLPQPSMPSFDPMLWGQLLPGAAAVAFIGLLSSVSIGKALAIRRREPFDSSQEMIGQGLASIIGSFFSCYAGSGSFTRSGLNHDSGARTPLSAIFASVILAAMLMLFAPFVAYVPISAMSALILFVVWRLINPEEIRHIISTSRSETVVLGVTFLVGLLSGLDFAIVVGVIASLATFLYNSSHPIVAFGAPVDVEGRKVFRNAEVYDLPQCPQIIVTRLEGPLFFASVENVGDALRRDEEKHGVRTRVVNLKGVGRIDLSGADFLLTEIRRARAQGRDLHLIAANPNVRNVLEQYHVLDEMGEANFHHHKSSAIRACVAAADPALCATCTLRIFDECAGKPGPV
jgi:SulP family sulfate permease